MVDKVKESLEDLVSYQKQLDQEEEFLTKLILQIDEQINRLQVEQMQLQSAMFENGSMQQMKRKPQMETPVDRTSEQLILDVPVNIKTAIEQFEEMEDEEDTSS